MTYADYCLEIAGKASQGPWHPGHMNENYPDEMDIDAITGECVADDVGSDNRNFIIESREMVPELAFRLNRALSLLKDIQILIKDSDGRIKLLELTCIIKELEAMPGEE